MKTNIDEARQYLADAAPCKDEIVEGLRELLALYVALYDRQQSRVGKAEAAFMERAHLLIRHYGPSVLGELAQCGSDLANALAAEKKV